MQTQFGEKGRFQLDINLRTLALAFQPVSSAQARWLTRERVTVLFWTAAIATLIVMATTSPAGWDARIYGNADQFLRHGVDPYAAGIAEQRAFQNRPASHQADHAPFTYVYSPLTLPLLRMLILLPDSLLNELFWATIAVGFFLQLWAGLQFADKSERRWLALLLPMVAFFPGLVTDDAILSGNISYLLYGLVLAAVVSGWKRGRWIWFYAAVLAASIFKMQLLTLLAFPILVGKRQWFPAGSTAAAALALVATQACVWPNLFREYLTTIRLMFDLIPDFGYAPAGVLGRFLWNQGRPYSSEISIMYLASAGVIGLILLFLADQVRQENISRDAWIPLALVGTFLLSPRIMKYDMAAITILMLLIASRGLRALLQSSQTENLSESSSPNRLLVVGAACFLIPNLLTVFGPTWWPVELIILLTTFAIGAWALLRPVPEIHPEEIPSFVPDPIGEPAFEIPAIN